VHAIYVDWVLGYHFTHYRRRAGARDADESRATGTFFWDYTNTLITNLLITTIVVNSRDDDRKRSARPNESFGPSQLPRGQNLIVDILFELRCNYLVFFFIWHQYI
jgi:hypothetical protein